MGKFEFIVYGEPKGKARPIVTRSGHAFTPKGTVMYENLVRLSFRDKYPCHVPIETALRCSLTAYYLIPKSVSKKKKELMLKGGIRPTKKPDADNIIKAVLDSLNGIAYKDDSQVVIVMLQKLYSDVPRVEVELEEVEDGG